MQMKHMLVSWHSVTEQEYPQYIHRIPHPDDIYLAKIENGGGMNDTCNSEHKENLLISTSVNGVVHSMFWHNHLGNIWVKNVLDSLTEFLRSHLNYSLDEAAPELRVSPGFMSLARDFEKLFSLCANYPKGIGKVFCQCIMYNQSGELIFHG